MDGRAEKEEDVLSVRLTSASPAAPADVPDLWALIEPSQPIIKTTAKGTAYYNKNVPRTFASPFSSHQSNSLNASSSLDQIFEIITSRLW